MTESRKTEALLMQLKEDHSGLRNTFNTGVELIDTGEDIINL
jgi:hypothetical protein